jgi:hypothetical protein
MLSRQIILVHNLVDNGVFLGEVIFFLQSPGGIILERAPAA